MPADGLGRSQAVHAGHLDVEDGQVRPKFASQPIGLFAIDCGTYDSVTQVAKHGSQAHAGEGLIVRDQHTHP
jgi:hypothetical protein